MKKSSTIEIKRVLNKKEYSFKVSYEFEGLNASVNVSSNKINQFAKVENNSKILKEIAKEIIESIDSQNRYKLVLNPIDSGTEWFGQFKKITNE